MQEFEDVYKRIYDDLPDGGTFVEIGSWTGRSAMMMARHIKNGIKNIDFHCVDKWEINPEKSYQVSHAEKHGNEPQNSFEANLKKHGLFDYVTPHKMDSAAAAKNFRNRSIDVVFIDAGHEYEDVVADIRAWYPKVKEGGIIAGHDYSHKFPGVVKAVKEFFTIDGSYEAEIIADKVPKFQPCWWHYKKTGDTRIHLYTVCWNEEILIPYFLRHYSEFCDTMTFYDNMSTDRTKEIISSYPNTEIIEFDTGNRKSNRKHMEIKNHCWTNTDPDYVIIVDADEFVYHPNIKGFLWDMKFAGYTLLEPVWIEMFGDRVPTENKPITEIINKGCYLPNREKKVMFTPGPIREMNYGAGAHDCTPKGRVVQYSGDKEFKLLHYKHLSDDYLIERDHIQRDRLSEDDRSHGWGRHYSIDDQKRLETAHQLMKKCKVVV